MFIDSCNSHSQMLKPVMWHSPTSTRIKNKVKAFDTQLVAFSFLQVNWSRSSLFCFVVGTDNCGVCRWLVLQPQTGEANWPSLPVQPLLSQHEFHLNLPYRCADHPLCFCISSSRSSHFIEFLIRLSPRESFVF